VKTNQRTSAGNTLLVAALGATLLLSGCASGGSSGSRTRVTETERVYRENGRVCRETEVTERSGSDGRRVAGTVAGAVVGGVVGHQLGSGRGNDAATLGGAAAGAYAGNQIAKDRGRVARSEVTTECTRSRR
jgi:outer membrane lipoprotein SlyB